MIQTQRKAVLITGANTGLGKDLARQLALRGDFDKIYLACRNEIKGRIASNDLHGVTGKSIFEVIVMDMADLASVRSALPAIDRPLTPSS